MIDWSVIWSIYGWGALMTTLFCSAVFVLASSEQLEVGHVFGAVVCIVFWPLLLPVLIVKFMERGA